MGRGLVLSHLGGAWVRVRVLLSDASVISLLPVDSSEEADDEDDPEYDFVDDVDEPDNEDYRTDRAVQITSESCCSQASHPHLHSCSLKLLLLSREGSERAAG